LPEIIERHLACETLRQGLDAGQGPKARPCKFGLGLATQNRLDHRPEIKGQERLGHRRFLQTTSPDDGSPIGMPKPLY